MWVFEEEVDGRKLTEIINTEHENVKVNTRLSLDDTDHVTCMLGS